MAGPGFELLLVLTPLAKCPKCPPTPREGCQLLGTPKGAQHPSGYFVALDPASPRSEGGSSSP